MERDPRGGRHPDLASLRDEYARGGLAEEDLDPDPTAMVRRWLEDAIAAGLPEPTAMVVATVDPDGSPSARTVLLKGLDERGFVFYTHHTSRKGVALAADPRCSLLLPWHALERQVRVEGVAERLTEEEAAAYFATRPRGAQVGAHASPQSQVVAGRHELEERYAEADERLGEEVPLPAGWGGYRVRHRVVELWQGRPNRMHDRLVYRRVAEDAPDAGVGAEWTTYRLAP